MQWVGNNPGAVRPPAPAAPIVIVVRVTESISGCRQASDLLLDAVGGGRLTDDLARQRSLLPGWSVGHVLTHLARNADSHQRMVEAAVEERVVDQYPGGPAQRDTEIEAGAHRSARQLVDDLSGAEMALRETWDRVPPEVWARDSRRWGTQLWPLAGQPFLRWREVALHSSDLGLDGLTDESWSDTYVAHELLRQVAALAHRLPGRTPVDLVVTDRGFDVVVMGTNPGDPVPLVTVAGTSREILAWLVGRGASPTSWPRLTGWQAVP